MLGDSFLRRQIQPSLVKGFDMEEESSEQFCCDSVSWCPSLSRNPTTELVNAFMAAICPTRGPTLSPVIRDLSGEQRPTIMASAQPAPAEVSSCCGAPPRVCTQSSLDDACVRPPLSARNDSAARRPSCAGGRRTTVPGAV